MKAHLSRSLSRQGCMTAFWQRTITTLPYRNLRFITQGDNLGQEVDPHSGLVRPVLDEVHGLPDTQLGLIAGGRRLLLV